MSKLDPNEAPEGYVAVEIDVADRVFANVDLCCGCDLVCENIQGLECSCCVRKDGCEVIFKKKEEPQSQQQTSASSA